MQIYWAHAAPAKVMIAIAALHMGAPLILLDVRFALGAFPDVRQAHKTLKLGSFLSLAARILMPNFLTFEAGFNFTVLTLHFAIPPCLILLNCMVAIDARTPD